MAHLNHESPFQSWVLSQEEFLSGSILTLTQKQNIQNQICALAIEKNNLEPDFSQDGSKKFLQKEAHLRGQIDALTHLIAISNETEEQLKQAQQAQLFGQQSDSLVPNS